MYLLFVDFKYIYYTYWIASKLVNIITEPTLWLVFDWVMIYEEGINMKRSGIQWISLICILKRSCLLTSFPMQCTFLLRIEKDRKTTQEVFCRFFLQVSLFTYNYRIAYNTLLC